MADFYYTLDGRRIEKKKNNFFNPNWKPYENGIAPWTRWNFKYLSSKEPTLDDISENIKDNTAVSRTYDSPNPLVTETKSLKDIISSVKNLYKEPDSLPIIGKDQREKKNAPPIDDNKIIESYEKDPYDNLVLSSKKAKESYENWISGKRNFDFKSNNGWLNWLHKTFNNQNLWDSIRLGVGLGYNEKRADELLKAANPNLMLAYRIPSVNITGDEAGKLEFYRRATLLQTRASLPFTSNAETSLAAMFDAYRQGNELKAQGDLLDNQRIRETSEMARNIAAQNAEILSRFANQNSAEFNLANARKHIILADKHLATMNSLDGFMKGILYRAELDKAERKSIYLNIEQLQFLDSLKNDFWLNVFLREFEAASKLPLNLKIDPFGLKIVNPDSEQIKEIQRKFDNRVNELQIKHYRNMLNPDIYSAKSGAKIVSKNIIKNFKEKHPKGNTRKYLLGGTIPFWIFEPMISSGEPTIGTQKNTSSTTKSSKKSEDDDLEDYLIKDLFKLLAVEGLPSDTNVIYAAMNRIMSTKNSLLGTRSISSDNLSTAYILLLQKINEIKFNKALYDLVVSLVNEKEAMSEYAIDYRGNVAVLNTDTGKISYEKPEDINESKGKYIPLTNLQLLELRAYDPNLAFDKQYILVASNATSMKEIAEFLKAQLPAIESSESTIQGYTKKDTADIKSGIRQLLLDAPEGVYEYTVSKKTNSELVRKALLYLYTILPNNMRTLLDIKSNNNTAELIATMIGAKEFSNDTIKVDASTGRAAKNADGTSKSSSGTNNSAGLAFVLGLGPRELISFNTGTSNEIEVLGIKGVLLTKSNENLGLGSTLQDATKSLQGGYLLWNKATFGGSRLNPSAYSHIILNDSTIIGMDLPFIKDTSGNEVPNFLLLKNMESADLEIAQNNIKNPLLINLIYLKYGLPPKYNLLGSLNTTSYRRFAAIQATLDENSLQSPEAILSDETAFAGEIERDLYVEAMQKQDKNYNLSDGMWVTGWGKDWLYKGTIFIPYDEDIAFAALSSGLPFDLDLPNNAALILLALYAPKTLTYKAPTETLSQIK